MFADPVGDPPTFPHSTVDACDRHGRAGPELRSIGDQPMKDVSETYVISDEDLELLDEPDDIDPIEAAHQLIATCEDELAAGPDAAVAARYHYEIAHTYETVLGDAPAARDHYQKALAADREHLAALRSLRRLLVDDGDVEGALRLLDDELPLVSEPTRKARLHYERGRLFEDLQNNRAAARAAYRTAIELCPNDPLIIHAAARCAREDSDWPELADLYQKLANAAADPRHRAALVVERARLLETRLDDERTAADLYESALRAHPDVPGVAELLERIYSTRGDWGLLVQTLQRAAEVSDDPAERALIYYRTAKIQAERLGDRAAAVDFMRKAAGCAPADALLLEELARLYREAGDWAALAEVLAELAAISRDVSDRVAIYYALGQVYQNEVDQPRDAVRCYQEALALDPTFLPALQAQGTLLAQLEDWPALVAMHLAEADVTTDSPRRASAHVRVAEIYETHLGRPDEAAAHYARALALSPTQPVAFKALVRIYSQLGEHRKLIELYERAVDQTQGVERKIAYLFKIGALWEDALNDPDQAAQSYRRVLAHSEDHLGALHALQRVCERAGRHQELVDYLLREAEMSTEMDVISGLRHRAAVVLDEFLGDTKTARQLLQQIIAMDDGYQPALVTLGRSYFREGRWRELLDIYSRELKVLTDAAARAPLLTRMGEIHESRLGDEAEAVHLYSEAVEADASYRPALDALTRLLRQRGQHSELIELLENHLQQLSGGQARAHILYRMAEIAEGNLSDLDGAIELAQRALREATGEFRPAALMVSRLLGRAERWDELAQSLDRELTEGRVLPAPAVFVHLALLCRDHLDDRARATAHFESARACGAEILALLALEDLYTQQQDWNHVVQVCAELAEHLRDPSARVAALYEVERVQARQFANALGERVHTCEAILAIDPDDPDALERLAALIADSGDNERLARLYARLGRAATDPTLAADAWLRLGRVMERQGDGRAADAYRSVLEKCPTMLSAVRGLARIAQARADHLGRAEAARLEAELRSNPHVSAALYVTSAEIRLSHLDDQDGAVADLEKALAKWPDSAPAAQMLVAPLRKAGQMQHLIDVLARAARAATDPERRAELWLTVGDAHAEQGDHGAAVSAVRRSLDAAPGYLPAWLRLAELYASNGQWSESIMALDQVVVGADDDAIRRDALLEQARRWHGRMNKPDRALASVEAALDLAPDHPPALALAARLKLETGDAAAAQETAETLLATATDPAARAEALTLAAAIETQRGDRVAAERHLAEAVAIQGVGSEPYQIMHELAQESGNWPPLAAAIEDHLRLANGASPARAYQALAYVYGDAMHLAKKAVEVLQIGLRVTGDTNLTTDLIKRLQDAGEHQAAADHLQAVLATSPEQPVLWRQLAQVLRRLGQHGPARLAAMPLVVLGAAIDNDKTILAGAPARVGAATPGSITAAELHAVSPPRGTSNHAADVIAAAGEALGKIYGGDLKEFGVSKRDRLAPRAQHPLRAAVDRLTAITAVECELFINDDPRPNVNVALTETLALVASSGLVQRPAAEHLFLLGRPIVLATIGLHPVLALPDRSVAEILAAAAPIMGSEAEIMAQRVRKALSRRGRKAFELAAAAYASAPLSGVGQWRRDVLRAANRIAALIADDLPAVTTALAGCVDPGGSGRATRDDVLDLLRFWMSAPAQQVREHSGLMRTST
jgi:cellulose synthase operon protein C